ncbi:uncharacterized protein LOC134675346 [Cydia fagiglandana]|uniref:uncharacterized protein LOC134675346 n=1 Tax=Cydia fagiglandana TaxID=1458189 RepID=UPI002FEE58C8
MSEPGRRRRFCLFGCPDLGAPMHSFPHPERKPELFRTWLSIVGDRLKETDPLKIYKNKKICDHHFTPDQKVACHRLINKAVPSVNFEGVTMSSCSLEIEHNYPLPNIGNRNTANLFQENRPNDEELKERLHPTQHPSTSQTSFDKGTYLFLFSV